MAQTGQGLQFVNETNTIIAESNGGFYTTTGIKRALDDSDSDDSSSSHHLLQNAASLTAMGQMGMAGLAMEDSPKPGKKTKGRVKIKMEFIENKLRRYTTFSKRKTGIMKKAYELSTLTGTQVMLLVASETGHVYTFATRKLQPMITSDSGKALIQTCLNSPDGNAPIGAATPSNDDQRMNPTGFEEPELSYGNGTVSEDDHDASAKNLPYPGQPVVPATEPAIMHNSPSPQPPPPAPAALPVVQQPPSAPVAAISAKQESTTNANAKSSTNTVPVQFPNGNILVPQSAIAAGTPIAMAAAPFVQGTANQPSSTQQQAMYRIPTPAGQMVSLPSLIPMSSTAAASTATSSSAAVMPNSIAVISGMPASAGGVAGAPPQGTVMYQTPQGVVYAASPGSLPEGYNLIVPQPPVAPTIPPREQQAGPTQQYITIPVSSLTPQNQHLLQNTPVQNATDLSKPK